MIMLKNERAPQMFKDKTKLTKILLICVIALCVVAIAVALIIRGNSGKSGDKTSESAVETESHDKIDDGDINVDFGDLD